MATTAEVFQALNEKAGFKTNSEWTKDTFTEKKIVPGKISLYYQTGTGKESIGNANFGFSYEGIDKTELGNLKAELHNILVRKGHSEVHDDGFYAYVEVPDLVDRSTTWVVKMILELERRVLFEFSDWE
jgi:hypothetical protein